MIVELVCGLVLVYTLGFGASTERQSPTSISGNNQEPETDPDLSEAPDEQKEEAANMEKSREVRSIPSLKGSYWLTRLLFVRYVGFIYFVAFVVAASEYQPLLGEKGLTPAKYHMERLHKAYPDPWEGVLKVPTIFWFVEATDLRVMGLCYAGIALSVAVFNGFVLSAPVMLILWGMYHSIVALGQVWYSFGWESQLLETGFIAVWACPWLSLFRAFPASSPPPTAPLWAARWLLFRIMLGAGLIKIRGDQCWRDLTCMLYHYETQPNPNPLSWYFHNLPRSFQVFSTMVNHVVELPAPFFLLAPLRGLRVVGGVIQILFQIVLILSGNLSFLNWLTIAPAIACLDDAFVSPIFTRLSRLRALRMQRRSEELRGECGTLTAWVRFQLRRISTLDFDERSGLWARVSTLARRVSQGGLAYLLATLSVPVVSNLLSTRQVMNTSFDAFRLVNTYGAFGSVGKVRDEIVIEGTRAASTKRGWKEYQFKCKPGDVNRRPCLISPFHFRLDWLAWFAGFQSYQQNPWLVHLVQRLLQGGNETASLTSSLLAYNPFPDPAHPPRLVRIQHFRYKFTKYNASRPGDLGPLFSGGPWWERQLVGEYLPPLEKDNPSVLQFLHAHGVIP